MIPSFPFRLFAVLCAASIVWWRPIAATAGLGLRDDAYTHILLILPISVVLIVTEWNRRRWKPVPNFRAGSALLGLAILIGCAGYELGRAGIITADVGLSLDMFAVVMWWVGAFVFCFGREVFRACIFPLCFLLWLIPIPEFAVNHIVTFLQDSSASAARLAFAIVGIPVTQNGDMLSIPGLTLEVAKECSSIRSSLMLVVTTIVVAHLLLRSTAGKALVMLAAIPLSIAKNGLRIFTISVLGVYVDPEFLNGRLHHQGGIVFFLLSLGGLFVLLWLVASVERKTAQAAARKVASVNVGAGEAPPIPVTEGKQLPQSI